MIDRQGKCSSSERGSRLLDGRSLNGILQIRLARGFYLLPSHWNKPEAFGVFSSPRTSQGEFWGIFYHGATRLKPTFGMQGGAVNFDLFPDKQKCRRWSGEPMMPLNAACNLCMVTVEKRIREEEAWTLQKSLQDGVFRFQDWLQAAERVAASPRSSQVSYAGSKKELQRFRALQKDISEKVWSLESLNRQYRQLVWMGNISPRLKCSVQEVNWRWEELRTRAAAVSRRLQHFVSQWEKFGLKKETIQVRLMELDLRLTDVEHFSGGTPLEKMIQLQAFQQDVQTNTEHVDHLVVCAENLIQKSQPEDAEILEEDLKELIGFHQAVLSRVFQFQRRLVSMRLVFEDQWESDRDSDMESDCFTEESLAFRTGDPEPAALTPEALWGHSTPKPARCCRVLVGESSAADLEWDPSVDVGGSTSQDEDSSYYSAVVGFGRGDHLRRRSRSWRWSWGRTEDFSVQSSFPEEGEPGAHLMETDVLGPPTSQEPGAAQLPRTGVCCPPLEATRFDPKRIETWLDQNCQNQMGIPPEIKEDSITHGDVLPPAKELQLPLQIQTRGRKVQRWSRKKGKQNLLTSQSGKGQRISKTLNAKSAKIMVTIEKECDLQLPTGICAQPQKLCSASVLWLLLTTMLAVLVWLLCQSSFLPLSQPPCLQANGFAKSFHLMLKYEGPPPT
ncbi:nesprin-4 isoform X2 [Pantherophis guttatus]|uniref:Nesprin-4 isoform X2 n=1 Tax=Pantherophis guttatus TaxID=94885 RepID=A0A6P9DEL9_PANGU|nr:nesprin-4 isoform X2 [Pantherophis guttatus]